MLWVRKLFVGVLLLILLASLLGAALSASFTHTFSNPVKIEGWLDQSDLYSVFTDRLVSDAQKSLSGSNYQLRGLNNFIKPAVVSAIPKPVFNQDVHAIVNSNYLWLEGRSSSPNFKLDLSTIKQSINDQVNRFVQTQIAALPTCTKAQLLQLQASNPVAIACKLPSINYGNISTQLVNQIDSSSTFLNSSQLTAANLSSKSSPNTLYYQKFASAPSYYQWSLKLPWLLAALALICALGIVFCSSRKRRGIRDISIVLLISGTLLIVVKALSGEFTKKVSEALNNNSQLNTFHQVIINLFNKVEASEVKIDLEIGIFYIILALTLIILLLYLGRRKTANKALETNAKLTGPNLKENSNNPMGISPAEPRPPRPVDPLSPRAPQASSAPTSSAPLLRDKPKPKNRRLIQ